MTSDEVDDKIDEWHEGGGLGVELHEHLGWSIVEYDAWVRTGQLPA